MDTTTQAWGPGPVPPPPRPRRPLARSRTNRKVAGVAGGLAASLDLPAWLVRLGFVILLIPGGLGLLLYALGWVLMPDADGTPALAEGLLARMGEAPAWVPIVVLVAVVLFFFQGWWLGAPGAVLWAAVIVGAGIWLYHHDAHRPSAPPSGPGPVPGPTGASSTDGPAPEPAAGAGSPAAAVPGWPAAAMPGWPAPAPATGDSPAPGGPAGAVPGWPAAPAAGSYAAGAGYEWAGGYGAGTGYGWAGQPAIGAPVVRPARPRSPLGRMTMAIGLVVLGVAALADRLGIVHASGRTYPALALLVVGAGLLVGAFWGRARLLILVGVVTVPLALVTNLAVVVSRDGSGAPTFVPTGPAAVERQYRLGAGQLTLDFTNFSWPGTPVVTAVSLGAGNVEIEVPATVTINFKGHVGAGVIQFLDTPVRSGLQIDDRVGAAGPAGGPVIDLTANVMTGRIDVTRANASPSPVPTVPPLFPKIPPALAPPPGP
jgi:phage shock protein PspC (stress-responsive transcriptional regulator)